MPYTVRMNNRATLTKKQADILRYVRNYSAEQGYAPTIPEIARFFKLYPSGAHQHLRLIEQKGYIRRTPNIARGLVILKRKERK